MGYKELDMTEELSNTIPLIIELYSLCVLDLIDEKQKVFTSFGHFKNLLTAIKT